jgi:hypothetical protein
VVVQIPAASRTARSAAGESETIIEAMRETGRLQVLAGRLLALVDTGRGMEVHYRLPVPEIRVQAERLARVLVAGNDGERT